jgi:Cu+-exporting ATPase
MFISFSPKLYMSYSCQPHSPKIEVFYDANVLPLRLIAVALHHEGVAVALDEPSDGLHTSSSKKASALEQAQEQEIQVWRSLLTTSVLFSLPVFLLSMVLPQIGWFREILLAPCLGALPWKVMLCWALTTPVQFGVGARFYRAAWLGLTHGRTSTLLLFDFGFPCRFALQRSFIRYRRGDMQ